MPAPRVISDDHYGTADHGAMIADRRRIRAYSDALRQAIKPDSIVLDIGTGVGIFALLACQFGARRVIAVEPDDVIDLARELAVDNGYEARIEFIQDVSTNVTLDQPADVIVSDLRGTLPLYRQHIPVIMDARERLLARGGSMIPREDRIWAAVVDERQSYRRYLEAWRDAAGLDMETPRGLVANSMWATRLGRAPFLSDAQRWAALDYRTIAHPNVSGSLEWAISRPGLGHGISLWFEAVLADGVGFSVSPRSRESTYRSAFFPFPEPLRLELGDMVSATMQASLIGTDYVWRWDTVVTAAGDPERTIASFEQCTLNGVLPRELDRVTATHVPTLNEHGRLDALVLARMSSRLSLDEIAREILGEFPDRFAAWDEAFDYVAGISARYGR